MRINAVYGGHRHVVEWLLSFPDYPGRDVVQELIRPMFWAAIRRQPSMVPPFLQHASCRHDP